MKYIFLTTFVIFCYVHAVAQNKKDIANYTSKQQQYGFIENKGQIHDQNYKATPEVKYILQMGNGMNVQLKKNSFSYDTYKTEVKDKKGDSRHKKMLSNKEVEKEITYFFHRVDVELIGANANPEIIAEEPSMDYINYYNAATHENGATEVRSFKKVTYKNIYDEIDMVFVAELGKEKPVEYTFIINPGADANHIKLHYIGANHTKLDDNKITIEVVNGSFTECIPASWVKETNNKINVAYKIIDNNIFGFDIPQYNSSQTLIIDPNPNLDWGTYYGGTNDDSGFGITCDANSNVFVTGYASSSTAIATAGAHQTTFGGSIDAFVVKFNNNGVRQWGTYYGGTNNDKGREIACDGTGNIYITGSTLSTTSIATAGSHQTSYGGGTTEGDAFIAKFNNNGIRQWGTYYGGSADENYYSFGGIACDGSGNVFIAGYTESANAIATAGAHKTILGPMDDSYGDAFVAKFNSSGVRQWGTYYGGNYWDIFTKITCDVNGNVFVTGSTDSDNSIATAGAHQTVLITGNEAALIVKFNNNGVRQWGTYYGDMWDQGLGIACDASGNIFVTGFTSSSTTIATVGAHQTTLSGSNDVFVVKFNNTGVRQWGTYYGGAEYESGNDIACDGTGNVYIVGYTISGTSIATFGTYSYYNESDDAFTVKFNNSGVRQWGTYYGGVNADYGNGIACDGTGNAIITGNAYSTTIATIGSHQPIKGGGHDAFIAKFSTCDLPANSGVISGLTTVCQGQNSVIYTVPVISNATSYVWTLPSGATGTSSTNSITVNYGAAAVYGNITVYGQNSCGAGQSSTLAISVDPLPEIPDGISGYPTVCQGQNSVNYSVTGINYTSTYIWSLPSGASGTSSTNSITVNYGTSAVSGNITVKGNNNCGDGPVSSKLITVNPQASDAGAISGLTTVCQGQNSVIYTVPVISNATSYVWTLPSGATGTSSTNSITVNYGAAAVSGNITVKGYSGFCNYGSTSTLFVTVIPLTSTPTLITGSTNVCQGQNSVTYNTTSNNAVSYVWTTPVGSSGTSTTNSITLDYSITAVSGNITVYGQNSCGNSSTTTKAITVNPLPESAGMISGFTNVCQGQSLVNYSVPLINNATSYVWTKPTGTTGSSSTNSIDVNYGTLANSGNISVKGHNSCGDGAASTIAITVNPLPDIAGSISGTTIVCQGQNSVYYSVLPIINASSYTWSLPTEATGTSTSNNINVNFSSLFTSGYLSVNGTNSCGDGINSSIYISKPFPETRQICYVEFDTLTQKNKAYWSTQSNGSTDSICVYRELTLGNWVKIGSTLYSNSCFVDLTSNPMNQSYNYVISAIDTCNSESSLSSNHKTITLIKSYDQLSNTYGFSWSAYEGLTVPQYNVYGVEATGSATIIGTVPGNSYMYNYTNPLPIYVNYFVGFDATSCLQKTTHTVKSNYVNASLVNINDNHISQINIYPNPIKEELTIEYSGIDKLEFEILNSIGQIVFKGKTNGKTVVNTSNFAQGIYMLKLDNGKTFEFRKIIKE